MATGDPRSPSYTSPNGVTEQLVPAAGVRDCLRNG